MNQALSVETAPLLIDFHNSEEAVAQLPHRFHLRSCYYVSLIPELHKYCATENISLRRVPIHEGVPATTVMRLLSYFLTRKKQHPLGLEGVNFVIDNIDALLVKAGLSEEITRIIFPAAVFFPSVGGPAVVSVCRITRDVWQIDPIGFGVERQCNPLATVIAQYTA